MTLKRRFQVMTIVSAAGLLAVAAFWVHGEHATLLAGKVEKTRDLLDGPYSIIEQQYKLESQGKVTRQQAQRAAIEIIRSMRYEGENYFWINDDHPTMVMHPIKPALDGTDLTALKDPSGKAIFVEFVSAAHTDPKGAFVEYLWPKPGKEQPVRKLSFVRRFAPWGWVIGTGIYIDDVDSAWRKSALVAVLLASVCLLPLVLAALTTWRFIFVRLRGMVERLKDVAEGEGDLTKRIPVTHDEIGEMAEWFNVFLDKLQHMIKAVAKAAQQVAGASEDVSSTSRGIAFHSEQTSAKVNAVSQTSGLVSQNLQTVATGAEEMGASINEIAKNATEAAKIAIDAVNIANTTTAIVGKLGDASGEIGEVIRVITSIAKQTNLLALNATIESARAGEAGKGFAVVANEVKDLAKETGQSAEDISRKVEAIQAETRAVVEAIASMSAAISRVNDISGVIATAVEEQNATTNEMSRNVTEAARGSGEITSNIAGVLEAAEKTSQGAVATQQTTAQLLEMSTQLRQLIGRFKTQEDGRAGRDSNATDAFTGPEISKPLHKAQAAGG